MKVTFVYQDYCRSRITTNVFQPAVAQLSACLKSAGHKTSLIHIKDRIKQSQFVRLLNKHHPDLLAFSFTSLMFPYIKNLISWAEPLNIPIICGGNHPSVAPDEVLSLKGVTAVCLGEGDEALVEFCNKLEKNQEISNIKNIHIKTREGIIKNPVRPLLNNLDSLPGLDYELFEYERIREFKYCKRIMIQAGRGCPYNCGYCTSFFKNLYTGHSNYVRFRSVDRLLELIECALKTYPQAHEIGFMDDSLITNQEWFREFVQKYKSCINLPYCCSSHPNEINPEMASLLKKSNCFFIGIGIENGNSYVRNNIMRRGLTDKHITDAFSILKSVNIQTLAFNILGAPEETMKSLLDTVKLNAQVNPDYVSLSYFVPLKGTALYKYCREKNYLTNKFVDSFYEKPVIRLMTVKDKQIIFIYRYFNILKYIYKLCFRLNKKSQMLFIQISDRILGSPLFPYRLFNLISINQLRLASFLQGYPPLYRLFKLYLSIRYKRKSARVNR